MAEEGSVTKPAGELHGVSVYLSMMAPEAHDVLDAAMEQWQAKKAGLPRQPDDEVYAFAYWLIRYSGLVTPRRALPKGEDG